MNLEKLGFGPCFENNLSADERLQLEKNEIAIVRVIEESKDAYRISDGNLDSIARLTGKLRHTTEDRGDLPSVGDFVICRMNSDPVMIHRVLNRKSKFARKVAGTRTDEQIIAANVDTVFVAMSLNQDLNIRRLERYVEAVWAAGAKPVLLLTKADLATDLAGIRREVEAKLPHVSLIIISSVSGIGLDEFAQTLVPGQTHAIVGSSGVGKSSVLNMFLPESERQTVLGIRRGDDKGQHTTTSRTLFCLENGALMIDTPGMREFQLWLPDEERGSSSLFQDIDAHAGQCRFSNCLHDTEPGCAIRLAIESGSLTHDHLMNYQKITREMEHLERKVNKRAMSDAKRQWKKRGQIGSERGQMKRRGWG